jgi:hypothetical protein
MARRLSMLLLAVSLSGCFARGFDHNVLTTHLQQTSIIANDEEITKAQALKPQLTFPCRVAVYLPPQVSGRWKAKEKEIVDSWERDLKKEGIVTDMFVMSEMFTHGDSKSPTMMDLRVAAAKHGASALLVIQGDCEVDSYMNPAAVFNLTVIGGYIIPASHRDALVQLQGALVDVGNGFLYTSIDAEGEGAIIRPTFIVEDKPAVEKAKLQALTNFGPELLKRMRAVRANFTPSSGVINAVAPAVVATPAKDAAPVKETVTPVSTAYPVSSVTPVPAVPQPVSTNRAAERWEPPTTPVTPAPAKVLPVCGFGNAANSTNINFQSKPAAVVPAGSSGIQPIPIDPTPPAAPPSTSSSIQPIIK